MIRDAVHAQWVAETWLRGLGLRWSFDVKGFEARTPPTSVVPAVVLPDSSAAAVDLLKALPLHEAAPRAVALVRGRASASLAAAAATRSIALFALDDEGDARALSPEAERLWVARFGSPNDTANLDRVRRSAKRVASGSAGWTLPLWFSDRLHGLSRRPGWRTVAVASTVMVLAVGGAIALVPHSQERRVEVPSARATCSYDTPAAADSASSVALGLKNTVYSAREVISVEPQPRPAEPRLAPTSAAGVVDMRARSDVTSPAVVVEVFASSEDAEDRSAAILSAEASKTETHQLAGAVLVRLSDRLTDGARKDYVSALGCG